MVVDEKGRTAHLRWLSQRAGALAGERGAGGAAEEHDAGRSDGRGVGNAQRGKVVFFSSTKSAGAPRGLKSGRRVRNRRLYGTAKVLPFQGYAMSAALVVCGALSILCSPSYLLAQTPPVSNSTIRFEDATTASGINFTHSFGAQKLGSLLEGTGGGCVWFDYNNDGRPDLYVTSGKPLEAGMHPYPLKQQPENPPHNHLFRNDGNGKFMDVTEQAGVAANIYGTAAIAADYDNDGHEDLFVTGYGKAILYHNKGDGTFEDVTAKAGINVDGWSISSVWLDYDRDGCVDLFVGRYVKFDPKYRAYYAADNYPGPLDYEGTTNKLFHNNCDGTFTDVTDKSGIGAYVGRTMGVTAADFDNDGWDDIYVANDRTENFLFHNKHDGTFEEIANETGTAYGQNGESTSSMGPVFADLEGRGVLDLWVSDGHYNRLLHNTGAPADGSSSVGWKTGAPAVGSSSAGWNPGKMSFEDIGASNGVSQAN